MQASAQPQFLAAAFSLSFVAGAAAHGEAMAFTAVSQLPIATMDREAQTRAVREIQAGASFVVRSISGGARGVLYGLECTAGGARFEVDVCQRAGGSTITAGTVVEANILRTGYVLTAGGRPVAFVPNALGRAMLRV